MQKLYETYERCAGRELDGVPPLIPISHMKQQAHIEIVLDAEGSFRRASVLDKDESKTVIPCTEKSDGRSGTKPVNHPLSDNLQYVAGDYLTYGGEVTRGFKKNPREPYQKFLKALRAWATSDYRHPKLDAILRYVEKGQVLAHLVREKILPVEQEGKLLKEWTGEKDSAPPIFKVIPKGQSPEDAFVRWRVEVPGVDASATWEDAELISAWISYYQQLQSKRGYCMVTGNETSLAVQHPAKLRHGGDKAKLISSNDKSGYTFRGRFLDANQTLTVSFDVTQKAHKALQWLIQNQSRRSGDSTIISWAVSGKPLPDPLDNTLELFGHAPAAAETAPVDTAQAFALRLASAIRGYRAKLDATENIVVMGLESATEGRMGITFYRELLGSEFLRRIEAWHNDCAWLQTFGKEVTFIGAPAPRDIAEAAYGGRPKDSSFKTFSKATVERLLPCIVDSRPIPRDLVEATVRRASNRAAFGQKDNWEWEKVLGIACALFKGHHIERNYKMALEPDRRSRDYLYGRLLAVADSIESYALKIADEKRDTTAARLMQRFADRPASTWRTIALALRPYMMRLRASERTAGFLFRRQQLLDEITGSFETSDFISDARLKGEFLLAYHCQRQSWRATVAEEESTESSIEN